MDSRLKVLKCDFKTHWFWLPNLLTETRLVGGPIFGALVLISLTGYIKWWVLLVIFLSLAITDCFDGLTARLQLLGHKSEFGRLLDPVADTFFGVISFVTIVIRNQVQLSLHVFDGNAAFESYVIWLLAVELVVYHLGVLCLVKKDQFFQTTIFGKIKTALVSLVTVCLLLPQQYEIIRCISMIMVGMTGIAVAISFIVYYHTARIMDDIKPR